MLYKVTPMMTPVEGKKPATDPHAPPKEARKRRKSAVFDAEGNEVLITMMCLKCRAMKPLAMFGLRKMADGAIRNQPWCRTCRSGAGTKKKPDDVAEVQAPAEVAAATSTASSADAQEVSGEHALEAVTPAAPRSEADESRSVIEQILAGAPPA